jgi:hypothetical protein
MAKQTEVKKKPESKSDAVVRAETEARAEKLFQEAVRNLNKNALASVKEAQKTALSRKGPQNPRPEID